VYVRETEAQHESRWRVEDEMYHQDVLERLGSSRCGSSSDRARISILIESSETNIHLGQLV
jgi:hypothetical protein